MTQDASATAETDSTATTSPAGLTGNLGVPHLVFTVMAFQAPVVAFMAYIPVMIATGNGVGSPAAILVAGVVLALFAVGLIAMSRSMSNPGGFYAYITAGLGREAGLGASFIALICYFFTLVGIYALLGVSLESLCRDLFHGPDITWWVWTAIVFVIVTALGHFRMDVSAKVLSVFLILELVLISAYDIAVIARNGTSAFSLDSFAPDNVFSGSLGLALMMGVGLFGGFEATLIFREEVKRPERTIPRATFLVIAIVAIFFAFTTMLFINAGGAEAVLASAGATDASMASIQDNLGSVAVDIATVLLVTSSFAVLLAAHNITARYLFSLGTDAIIPRTAGLAHPKHGSPHVASAITSVAVLVVLVPFVLADGDPNMFYARFVGVYSYSLLALLFLTSLAVPVYLIRRRDHPGVNRWNSIVCPVLAVIPLAIVVVFATKNFSLLVGASAVISDTMLAAIYLLFVFGVVLALIYRRRRPEVYAQIGRQQ
ncbi:APC family permease [Gordonia mangrovi]|nr:APC family permease [Gordonia mangrovi]UVF76396.1 APC family permease [Gordonia mangrovi]